jgi:hypothetical protein
MESTFVRDSWEAFTQLSTNEGARQTAQLCEEALEDSLLIGCNRWSSITDRSRVIHWVPQQTGTRH